MNDAHPRTADDDIEAAMCIAARASDYEPLAEEVNSRLSGLLQHWLDQMAARLPA